MRYTTIAIVVCSERYPDKRECAIKSAGLLLKYGADSGALIQYGFTKITEIAEKHTLKSLLMLYCNNKIKRSMAHMVELTVFM